MPSRKRARAASTELVVRAEPSDGSLRAGLAKLWRAGTCCDVELVVEGRSFSAHRVVLAAESPCLAALVCGGFAEAGMPRIELQEIAASIFERALDFLYLQECTLASQDELQPLLRAACHFQIAPLQAACEAAVAERLDASNCLRGLALADALTLSSLRQSATDVALASFEEAAAAEDGAALAALPAAMVGALLASDELKVAKEEAVLGAAKAWLAAQQPAASSEVARGLLEHVRFPLVDDLAALERDELLLQHPALVMRAYREKVTGEATPRTRRRGKALSYEDLETGMTVQVSGDAEFVKEQCKQVAPGADGLTGWTEGGVMEAMVGHEYQLVALGSCFRAAKLIQDGGRSYWFPYTALLRA